MITSNPRFDLFKLALPTDFFKTAIIGKYNEWMSIEPRNVDNIISAINQSIQTISLPSFGITPIIQQNPQKGGAVEVAFNTVQPFDNLIEDKNFTITFKHGNGFMNYFLLLEHYYQYADSKNGTLNDYSRIPDIPLMILDTEGNVLFTFTFIGVIFIGLTELELSKSKIQNEFTTFDGRFIFTSYKLDFHTPERELIHN